MSFKQQVSFLIIRGISDFKDSSKDNAVHTIASETAAIVAVEYFTYGWTRSYPAWNVASKPSSHPDRFSQDIKCYTWAQTPDETKYFPYQWLVIF